MNVLKFDKCGVLTIVGNRHIHACSHFHATTVGVARPNVRREKGKEKRMQPSQKIQRDYNAGYVMINPV